jgi:hypothetical protein
MPPIQNSVRVELNSKDLAAVVEHFARYVQGYHRMDEPNSDPSQPHYDGAEEMVLGWEAFKKEVGKITALEVYWTWVNSLPHPRPSCDPDGN